eukprot:Tbor_TRINITY_DN2273_c0_g1::TRINITY_DN2273_c0_g1_i1::g.2676::m.2676
MTYIPNTYTILLYTVVSLAFLYRVDCMKGKAKKLRSFPTFEHAMPWIECDVCREMVIIAHDEVATLRKTSPLGLREETIIEDVTDLVCNPRNSKGWWLREFELVSAKNAEDSDLNMFKHNTGLKDQDKYQVFLKPLSFITVCESDCMTLAESCRRLMDGDEGDKLSPLLYKFKQTRSELVKEICDRSCTRTEDLVRRKMKLLEKCFVKNQHANGKGKCNIPFTPLSEEFLMKKLPANITSKELEIEEMMDNMDRTHVQNTPKMEVYERETVLEMQRAMITGTKEDVAKFDPDIAELSDSEFAELQRMYREEKGGTPNAMNNGVADGLGSFPEDTDLSNPEIRV